MRSLSTSFGLLEIDDGRESLGADRSAVDLETIRLVLIFKIGLLLVSLFVLIFLGLFGMFLGGYSMQASRFT